MTRKRGRPTKFTKPVQKHIAQRIAQGESAQSICKDPKLPTQRALYKYLATSGDEDFVQMYREAIQARADVHADQILEIAEDDSGDLIEVKDSKGKVIDVKQNNAKLRRDQMRIEARQWHMARMNPRKYGQQTTTQHEHDHQHEITAVPNLRQLSRAILQVLGQAAVEPLQIEATKQEKP